MYFPLAIAESSFNTLRTTSGRPLSFCAFKLRLVCLFEQPELLRFLAQTVFALRNRPTTDAACLCDLLARILTILAFRFKVASAEYSSSVASASCGYSWIAVSTEFLLSVEEDASKKGGNLRSVQLRSDTTISRLVSKSLCSRLPTADPLQLLLLLLKPIQESFSSISESAKPLDELRKDRSATLVADVFRVCRGRFLARTFGAATTGETTMSDAGRTAIVVTAFGAVANSELTKPGGGSAGVVELNSQNVSNESHLLRTGVRLGGRVSSRDANASKEPCLAKIGGGGGGRGATFISLDAAARKANVKANVCEWHHNFKFGSSETLEGNPHAEALISFGPGSNALSAEHLSNSRIRATVSHRPTYKQPSTHRLYEDPSSEQTTA